jgi:hypothetical protein
MHAIVVSVSISGDADPQETVTHLREKVVPAASQAPGFVAGYWVRLEGGDRGRATIVFDSEDAARGARDQIQPAPGVTIESVDVGEVIANA